MPRVRKYANEEERLAAANARQKAYYASHKEQCHNYYKAHYMPKGTKRGRPRLVAQ